MLACGKENFADLTPMDERKLKYGDSGGCTMRLQTLCGLSERRLLAHFKVPHPGTPEVGRQTWSQGCSLLSVPLLCCVLRGRACDL